MFQQGQHIFTPDAQSKPKVAADVRQIEIVDGIGKFSGVNNFRDVIGGYATAEANAGNRAGAGKAQVVSKGSISLALTGKGSGWTLDVSFGGFIISER